MFAWFHSAPITPVKLKDSPRALAATRLLVRNLQDLAERLGNIANSSEASVDEVKGVLMEALVRWKELAVEIRNYK